jgi:hypothetical protein
MSASPNRILLVTAVIALAGAIAGIGAFLIASRILGGNTIPAVIGFIALAAADVIALAVLNRRKNKKS